MCQNTRVLFLGSHIPAPLDKMGWNARASFSLWWHNWNTYSSSSTTCRNFFVQRHIPHIVHEPWQPLQIICMNSIFWGWPWSFTTNICTSLFTSIWVQLKVIILDGSHSICGEHPQKFCHELGLDFVSRATDLRDFT
jgi:hypothetical protein